MPKIPVVEANLTAERRRDFEFEHYLAEIVRPVSVMPLRAHDLESASRAYAFAVERGGDEFLEYCAKLPPNVRAIVTEVAKFIANGGKPR